MKHLIIYSHLNPKSFTIAIAEKVAETILAKGGEVKTIDLYADNFDPVMNINDIEATSGKKELDKDIVKYQEMISWADKLTFIYPIWWGQMPAQLKGFFDRVFTNGFAFSFDKNGHNKLLKDKTAQIFVNIGSPLEVYQQNGMIKALDSVAEVGLFSFCGIKVKSTYFGSVASCSNEQRKEYLKSIENIY